MTPQAMNIFWLIRGKLREAISLTAGSLVCPGALRHLLIDIETGLQTLRRLELMRD